jgi:hypothetical protein
LAQVNPWECGTTTDVASRSKRFAIASTTSNNIRSFYGFNLSFQWDETIEEYELSLLGTLRTI